MFVFYPLFFAVGLTKDRNHKWLSHRKDVPHNPWWM